MLIDLTHKLNQDTPVYPGNPELQIKTTETFENDTYLGHSVYMGTHAGTHIDAPAHMLQGTKTLDEFPIDAFVGRARYIKVEGNAFSLEAVQQTGLQEGDVVLFHTGMSDRITGPEYFSDYPAMSEEIARYLVECKVKMVGVDTCSVDNDPSFPIHKTLLDSDILIIENLTNLEQLQNANATIYALPIKLNLDGAPARVVAEVQ